MERFVDNDAFGNIEERAAGPTGGVEGGEFIGAMIHHAK